MRIAALVKKFISPVAALTVGLLLTTGLAPASATTPNADSNTFLTTANSNWVPNTSFVPNLAGAEYLSFQANFAYNVSGSALVGKAVTMTGSLTKNGATVSSYFSASVNFYDSNNMYISNGMISTSGAPYQNTVPANTTKITFYVSGSEQNNMNGNSVAPTLGATYLPTFAIQIDGTNQTLDTTYPAVSSPTGLYMTDRGTATQGTKAGSVTGSTSYSGISQYAHTCVDLTNISAGSVLNLHPIDNGTDVYSSNSYYSNFSYKKLGDGAYNWTPVNAGRDLTVTSAMKQENSLLIIKNYHSNPAGYNTNGSTVSTGLSIQSGGVEVSTACSLGTISSSIVPTLNASGSFLSVSVSDPSLSQSSWSYKLYKESDNSVVATGTGYGTESSNTIRTCGNSGCVSPVAAGVRVYVKISLYTEYGNLYGMTLKAQSTESAASAVTSLADPWITVSPAVSGGTNPGDATLVGSNIDYANAAQDPSMMVSSMSTSDGNNGVFKPVLKLISSGMPPVLEMRLFRLGATGIDTTFAGSGTSGVLLPATMYTMSARAAWYGARNKWSAIVTDSVYQNNGMSYDWTLVTGTFAGSATSTPQVFHSADVTTFCRSEIPDSQATGMNAVSAPTSFPLVSISCSKSATINGSPIPSYSNIYVKVNSDGTFTKLLRTNNIDASSENGWRSVASVANVSATANSDVAWTIVGYTFLNTTSTSAGNIVARKGYQFKVDGTVTEVQNPYSSSATSMTSEKSYAFSRTATGTATTGLLRIAGQTGTTYKLANMSASGVITDGQDLAIDSVPAFVNNSNIDTSVVSFVDGQEVGTGGKVQLKRSTPGKVAQMTLDLDTKTVDTGEVVTYANSTDPRVVQFYLVDDSGRLNWMFTSGNNKLSNIRWNGTAGGGALPNGVTVTSVSTKFITNAAAAVTITGTGLNTNTDSGGKYSVGSTLVTATTRTATKIVLTVPAGTVAGDISINGTFAGTGATIATVTRVGAAKQAQTIDDTADVTSGVTWSGVSTKYTKSFPATTSVGLPTTIKVDKAAICSVSGQVVTMDAAGTCVVTVSNAGDLGTNAATQTTTIVVAKRDKGNVSAITSAITAAATTWAGSEQSVTLPSLLTSVGLGVTVTVAPAAVCTLSGAIITLKAAGTCAVSVTGASDAGTDAIAKTVTNLVVAKGDLNLSVASSLSVSNNPADISGDVLNSRSVNADTVDAVADTVDYTFTSSNEDICTVDDNGVVSGVAVGNCVITTAATSGANWADETATTSVTVVNSSTQIDDVLPAVTDSGSPVAIVNNKSAFVATNDKSFLVKWDKAAGLLTYQATGVYIGFISVETTFTPTSGAAFTCTNVFGTTTALAGKTAAQRKAALKTKVFTAGSAACKDVSVISVPLSINTATDFAKIKKVAKAAGNATTVGSTKYETASQLRLKNFTGSASIKITRYRAWPTTMKNQTSAGTKIPATIRTTVINLQ